MSFRTVRHLTAPLAVLSVIVVAGVAHANGPHISCQSQAPHHTATLGPSVDAVSVTSTADYWDNECKCYIAQIDVPSTSTPASANRLRTFFLNQSEALPKLNTKEECETYEEKLYVYKKENGAFVSRGGSTAHGRWIPAVDGYGKQTGKNFCYQDTRPEGGPSLAPPATGTDVYRVLHSLAYGGKFHHVTVAATHAVNGPH